MADKPNPPPRERTLIESDEEVRKAIQARMARTAEKRAPAAPPPLPAAVPLAVPVAARVEADARPERPQQRPPMALLCVLDDGREDGEWYRLRADRCAIGRTEGDIVIPHDALISTRHAEILRQQTANGYRWVLNDLKSTNGTYVHVERASLGPRAEVMIGSGCYRFEPGAEAQDAPAQAPEGTLAWGAGGSSRTVVPALVELTPGGTGKWVALFLAEYWVGRDPSCQIVRADDPLVSARHARLYRDNTGQWHVENNRALNGLWLRVEQPTPLAGTCRFRLGEQRLLFQVL
jgi:hypothetical protein